MVPALTIPIIFLHQPSSSPPPSTSTHYMHTILKIVPVPRLGDTLVHLVHACTVLPLTQNKEKVIFRRNFTFFSAAMQRLVRLGNISLKIPQKWIIRQKFFRRVSSHLKYIEADRKTNGRSTHPLVASSWGSTNLSLASSERQSYISSQAYC